MFSLFSVYSGFLLLTTLALFLVSLTIQGLVFSSWLGGLMVGFVLAATFEMAKLVTVVGKPLLIHATRHLGLSMRLLLLALRIGLIAISIFCTVFFLAVHIDKPHLQAVRSTDINELKDKEQIALKALDTRFNHDLADNIASSDRRQSQRESTTINRFQPKISELESLITLEMENVSNRTFIGPRYKELQRRLEQKKAELEQSLDSLHMELDTQRTRSEQSIRSAYQQEKSVMTADYARQLKQITDSDYNDDDRVSVPIIKSARNLLDSALGIEVSDLAIGLVVSILISSVGEIALLCLLAFLAELVFGILRAEFDIWQQVVVRKLHTDLEVESFKQQRSGENNSIRRKREEIEKEARSYLRSAG